MGSINTMLTLDGESNFRRAISNIDKELKTLEAELKQATTHFSNNEDAMLRNSVMQESYAGILEKLKSREEVLTRARNASARAYEENTEKLKKLRAEHEAEQKTITEKKKSIEILTQALGQDSSVVIKLKEDLAKLISNEKATSKEISSTERAVQNNYNAYHRYRTQLAGTREEIDKVKQTMERLDQEMQQSDDTTTRAAKVFETLAKTFNTAVSGAKLLAGAAGDVGAALSKVANVSAQVVTTSVKAMAKEFEIATDGLKIYTEAFVKSAEEITKFSYNSGATFEESMSQVQAYSQASAEDMARLAQAAKDMGATTSKTASQSADALGYMALNGYKTEQMLASLKPVVKAAEAGHMDLAAAANLTSSTIKAYGLEVEQTEELLNILVAAQNNSATSLEDLLGAYTNSAAMFKTLNVPMAESATLLGVLANRGFKGTEIGNNLNSILVNLIGANKNAATAMEGLGISAWDAEGNFRGLTTVLTELGDAMNAGTDEQKAMIEAQIGGKRQFKTLEAMIAGVSEEYDELYEATSNALGNNVLYSTAETMMDNVKGSVTLLKSAFESLGIAIFETFNSDLNAGIKDVSNWVANLKSAVESGDVDTAIINLSHRIRGFIRDTFEKITKELPGLLKTYNTSIIQGLRVLMYAARDFIENMMPVIIESFTSLVVELIEMLPEMTDLLTDAAETFFTGMLTAINTILPRLADNIPMLMQAGLDLLNMIIDGIYENFPILVETAYAVVQALADGFAQNAEKILDVAFFMIMKLVDGAILNLPMLLDFVMTLLRTIVTFINENADQLVEAAALIIKALADFLLENLDEIIYMMKDITNAICDGLVNNSDILAEAAVELIGAIVQGLVAGTVALNDIAVEWVNMFMGVFGQGKWSDLGTNIIDGILSGIKKAVGSAGSVIKDAGEELKSQFASFFDIHSPSRLMKKDIGMNIGRGVIEGINDGLEINPAELSALQSDIQAATSKISLDSSINAGYEADGIQVAFYGPINLNNLTSDIDGFIEAIDDRVKMARMGAGR